MQRPASRRQRLAWLLALLAAAALAGWLMRPRYDTPRPPPRLVLPPP